MTPRLTIIERWAPVLIALAVFLAFLPALSGSFLIWDDEGLIVDNMAFRGFSRQSLRWMFTSAHGGPYQPLAWLSYALDYAFWGLEPFGYHLTSLVLHSANAALFFLVSRRLLAAASADDTDSTRDLAAAALAALLFAIHPLRVESVAWASERRDVIAGIFYLLALLLYLRGRRRSSLAAFALALLAKATCVSLPAILLILDVYPLRRLSPDPRRWLEARLRPVLVEKLPFILLALVGAVVCVVGQRTMIQDYGLAGRIVIPLYSAWFYVGKTLLPVGLSPLYEVPVRFDPFAPRLLWGAAAALTSGAALIALRRRFPSALTAGLCYAVTLLPVSGIVPFGLHLTADRYSYLACLPWALLAAGAWRAAATRMARRASLIAAAAGLIALGVLTWRQAGVWRSDMTLWGHALRIDPQHRMAHNYLGMASIQLDLHQKALTHFSEAARLDPGFKEAHINRCAVLAHFERWDAAVASCHRALALDGKDPSAHVNMGFVRLGQRRFTEAETHFLDALRLDPRNPSAPWMIRWLKGRGQKAPSIGRLQDEA